MAEEIKVDSKLLVPTNRSNVEKREEINAPSLNFLADSWRRLKQNKAAVICMVIIVSIIIIAILAPWIAPADPFKQNVSWANLPPKLPGVGIAGLDGTINAGGSRIDQYAKLNVPADTYFYLGTDGLGRDLLSRILYGTRISLLIAFAAAFFDLTIGVSYGVISAWFGGRVDTIMQRIVEILSGVPNLVVLVLMILVFKPGVLTIIFALAFTEWLSMSRVIRAQTLKLKNEEYIVAAKSLGQSFSKIAFKHLLPNLAGVVIIQTMFSIPTAIFFEAFLSFIGIGVPAPAASLGSLINDGYKVFRFLPHLMWYPAGVMCILMISFNLLADGLRDALDPKMKE